LFTDSHVTRVRWLSSVCVTLIDADFLSLYRPSNADASRSESVWNNNPLDLRGDVALPFAEDSDESDRHGRLRHNQSQQATPFQQQQPTPRDSYGVGAPPIERSDLAKHFARRRRPCGQS
jgi:hypothetical protein